MEGQNDQCEYYRHFRQKINYLDKYLFPIHPGLMEKGILVFL